MAAIIALLIVITLSVLITRIASTALVQTGLSEEAARFQARSAYTGVGFTTKESETITNHPVRRKIVFILFFLGNVGLISTISSLVLSVGSLTGTRVTVLMGGIGFLWVLAQSKYVEEKLSRLINKMLNRYTSLDIRDYYSLLHLSEDYRVSEITVDFGDWLASKTLSNVSLRDEGVLVLGIKRSDGTYIGAPRGQTKVYPEDTLVLYGREQLLRSLDNRLSGASGQQAHDDAVDDHSERLAKQEDIRQEL